MKEWAKGNYGESNKETNLMIRQHPRSHSQGPLDRELSERGYTKAKGEG
jgi:hypothetical protein